MTRAKARLWTSRPLSGFEPWKIFLDLLFGTDPLSSRRGVLIALGVLCQLAPPRSLLERQLLLLPRTVARHRPRLRLGLRFFLHPHDAQMKRRACLFIDPAGLSLMPSLTGALMLFLRGLLGLTLLTLRAEPFCAFFLVKDGIRGSVRKRIRAHSEAPRLPTYRNAIDIQRTDDPSLATRSNKLVLPSRPSLVINFALATSLPHRFDLGARINPLP